MSSGKSIVITLDSCEIFIATLCAVFPSNVPISKKFWPGFKKDLANPIILSNYKWDTWPALEVGLISFSSKLFQSVKELISIGTIPIFIETNSLYDSIILILVDDLKTKERKNDINMYISLTNLWNMFFGIRLKEKWGGKDFYYYLTFY